MKKLPPITVPAPRGTQTRCPKCRKPLRATYDLVWETADGRKLGIGACLSGPATGREFRCWGIDGIFCRKECGYRYAHDVVRYIRAGKLKFVAVKEEDR